jgi:non-heme chloroperoxidase
VVLLNYPGSTQTSKGFADMGVEVIAGVVATLVDPLGLGSLVLNGWSLSGAVIVDAATLLGGCKVWCWPVERRSVIYKKRIILMAVLSTYWLSHWLLWQPIEWVLAGGVGASEVSPQMVDWMWQMFLQSALLATQSVGVLGPSDQYDELAALQVPILSIVGGLDAVVAPAVCRSVSFYVKDGTVVECTASGHAPFIDEGERYHSAFQNFISKELKLAALCPLLITVCGMTFAIRRNVASLLKNLCWAFNVNLCSKTMDIILVGWLDIISAATVIQHRP